MSENKTIVINYTLSHYSCLYRPMMPWVESVNQSAVLLTEGHWISDELKHT